jgi:hypothetical protein
LISKRKWKRPLGRLGTRWEASLGICLKKWSGEYWPNSSGWRCRPLANSYECDNETSGFIKEGNFMSSWANIRFLRSIPLCEIG